MHKYDNVPDRRLDEPQMGDPQQNDKVINNESINGEQHEDANDDEPVNREEVELEDHQKKLQDSMNKSLAGGDMYPDVTATKVENINHLPENDEEALISDDTKRDGPADDGSDNNNKVEEEMYKNEPYQKGNDYGELLI